MYLRMSVPRGALLDEIPFVPSASAQTIDIFRIQSMNTDLASEVNTYISYIQLGLLTSINASLL